MDVCNFTVGPNPDRKLEESGTGGNNGVSSANNYGQKNFFFQL